MNEGGKENPLGVAKKFSPSNQYMAKQVDLKEFKCNDDYSGYDWYSHNQKNDYLGKVENYQHNLDSLTTGPLGKCMNHTQVSEFLSTPKTIDYITSKAHVVRPTTALKAPDLERIK
jgi:hypothetical protein